MWGPLLFVELFGRSQVRDGVADIAAGIAQAVAGGVDGLDPMLRAAVFGFPPGSSTRQLESDLGLGAALFNPAVSMTIDPFASRNIAMPLAVDSASVQARTYEGVSVRGLRIGTSNRIGWMR